MTEKHQKIASLMAEGLTAAQIGKKMSLSKRTIEKHQELMKATYGAKNVSHLIAILFRKELLN